MPAQPADDSRTGLSLLFADDERSLQELMKLELPRMGHTVTVCPDGLTAVAAIEKNNYDAIIVDLERLDTNHPCRRIARLVFQHHQHVGGKIGKALVEGVRRLGYLESSRSRDPPGSCRER